ncbi:MAG: urea carboxylase-associated family protein [Solirubrobacterales bacterium]
MATQGAVGETIHIPAREGRGALVKAGGRFRCIDVEGGQCGDLFAFCADNVREYQSAEHTRVWNDSLFPKVGEQFVTNRRRPILTFLADDTPGNHDMLIAACDPTRFKLLGFEGWHASCQENLEKVMAGFGFDDIEIPQPINVFTTFRWARSVVELGSGTDEVRGRFDRLPGRAGLAERRPRPARRTCSDHHKQPTSACAGDPRLTIAPWSRKVTAAAALTGTRAPRAEVRASFRADDRRFTR